MHIYNNANIRENRIHTDTYGYAHTYVLYIYIYIYIRKHTDIPDGQSRQHHWSGSPRGPQPPVIRCRHRPHPRRRQHHSAHGGCSFRQAEIPGSGTVYISCVCVLIMATICISLRKIFFVGPKTQKKKTLKP